MKKDLETSSLLPPEALDHASALLTARGVRRPPETLAFLAQRLLRWWTVIKGIPAFDSPAFKSLARDFREMGFDCLPGQNPRWTPKQRAQSESLFHELAFLVAASPDMALPALRLDLNPGDRPLLVRWIWNHVDHHVSALTIGLLGSGILAAGPQDPGFESQAALRDRVVQTVDTLVALALYLGEEHDGDPPLHQMAGTTSALLDGLAGALEEAFALGGTRGRWLAHCGDWERPAYPSPRGDFRSLLQTLPPGLRPR